jgi:hypothetical protein
MLDWFWHFIIDRSFSDVISSLTLLLLFIYTVYTGLLWKTQINHFHKTHRPWVWFHEVSTLNPDGTPLLCLILRNTGASPAFISHQFSDITVQLPGESPRTIPGPFAANLADEGHPMVIPQKGISTNINDPETGVPLPTIQLLKLESLPVGCSISFSLRVAYGYTANELEYLTEGRVSVPRFYPDRLRQRTYTSRIKIN